MSTPTDRPTIIFCATQRSGSTMIVDDFQNATGRPRSQCEGFYHHVLAPDDGPRDWPGAMAVLEKLREGEAAFFDKVMFHYLGKISRLIDPSEDSRHCDAFRHMFADATWVFIRRANAFDQAVSKYVAETMNVWDYQQRQGEAFNRSMPFELDKAKRYLKNFVREDASWCEFFAHHGIKPIEIYYEDATANFPHYLEPIFDKTGLEVDLTSAGLERRMSKVGNDRNARLSHILRDMLLRESLRTTGAI